MGLMLPLLTTTMTLSSKSKRLCLIWISITDISTQQDHQEPTTDHPLLRITEPELELHMADQDAPWAHDAITVESLDTFPTSAQAQSERKELALNVDRKIIWLRIAQSERRN